MKRHRSINSVIYLCSFLALKVKFDGGRVARVVDTDLGFGVVLILSQEGRLKTTHFVGLTMDENDVRRLQKADELAGLLAGSTNTLH